MRSAVAHHPVRLMRLLALALLAWMLHVGSAGAHASLNATQPIDGAVLQSPPATYVLTFSEPVSPLSLRLVRPDGSALELDKFRVRDRAVEITAPSHLGTGTHVLSWRVVSEDGHPVGGSVVFSIGTVSAQAPLAQDSVDWSVRGGLWLAKVALYVGLFVGVGGVFARCLLMPQVEAGSRVVAAALAVGAVGAVISLGFQGLDALDVRVYRIADPLIWKTGMGTTYGRTVILTLAALALAGLSLMQKGNFARVYAALALAMAALAPAVSGHASAAAPQWLMRPAVFLHAGSIAVWIGALAPLGLALRNGEPGALPALARFSRFIPAVVAVLVAAGIVLAIVQVEHPRALVETAYGQVLLTKLALLVGLFALASVNRWTLTASVEAGDPAAARRLVRSIATELLLALLVFGAGAAWRFTPPPRALAIAALAPATTHIHTAKAMADVTVAPGHVGSVDVSAVIMTGDFGPLDAKEVTFVFSNPAAGVEPFKRRAEKPGDGTWRAAGVLLPLPGEWKVRVDVLINDFEIARLEGSIAVRP
jgi:copper transport protein